MTEQELTLDAVFDAAREVIAERGPSYVYQKPTPSDDLETGKCVYSEDGGRTGSCLFGAVLIEKLHVPYDRKWEGDGIVTLLGDLGLPVRYNYDDRGPNPDPVKEQYRRALTSAQSVQDHGHPYSEVSRVLEMHLADAKALEGKS